MKAVGLLQNSLKSAFELLGQVTADLTPEQADWQPPGIANPIGALYWHTISGADDVVHRWILGEEPLYEREPWEERALRVSVPDPGYGGDTFGYMRTIRANLPGLHDYAKAVAGALDGWLGTLSDEDLARTINTPAGEQTVAHVVDLFVVWHINSHCGEISALKGCLGARGYPF